MRVLLLFVTFAFFALAQSSAQKTHFLIRIEPSRSTFLQDMTPAEQKIMDVHFTYLKKLSDEGKVVLAGPSLNGPKTFGIIVVEVDSEAEARKILEGDPSYKAGLQKGEVLPFRIAILRGAR